jgi:hypothetical protein
MISTSYKLLKHVFLNRSLFLQTCSSSDINLQYSISSKNLYPKYIIMADVAPVPIDQDEAIIALDEVDATIVAAEDNNDVEMKEDIEDKEESSIKPEEEKKKKDSYAYLERDEFTSELYKIEVKGLPKYYGFKVIDKKFTK